MVNNSTTFLYGFAKEKTLFKNGAVIIKCLPAATFDEDVCRSGNVLLEALLLMTSYLYSVHTCHTQHGARIFHTWFQLLSALDEPRTVFPMPLVLPYAYNSAGNSIGMKSCTFW